MNKQQILSPGLLEVKAPQGGVYMGGAQEWFDVSWKRTSGCGPTTASGILWYLSRSRQSSTLCEIGEAGKSDFFKLMNTVFDYVTPGAGGVYSTTIFADGIVRYGDFCKIKLQTRALNIRPALCKRPSREALRDFIGESLQADLPLAFLNLSNGTLGNLSSWHWVMLIALEPESMTATICDQGFTKEIDLGGWLKTTLLGGGLVSVSLC